MSNVKNQPLVLEWLHFYLSTHARHTSVGLDDATSKRLTVAAAKALGIPVFVDVPQAFGEFSSQRPLFHPTDPRSKSLGGTVLRVWSNRIRAEWARPFAKRPLVPCSEFLPTVREIEERESPLLSDFWAWADKLLVLAFFGFGRARLHPEDHEYLCARLNALFQVERSKDEYVDMVSSMRKSVTYPRTPTKFPCSQIRTAIVNIITAKRTKLVYVQQFGISQGLLRILTGTRTTEETFASAMREGMCIGVNSVCHSVGKAAAHCLIDSCADAGVVFRWIEEALSDSPVAEPAPVAELAPAPEPAPVAEPAPAAEPAPTTGRPRVFLVQGRVTFRPFGPHLPAKRPAHVRQNLDSASLALEAPMRKPDSPAIVFSDSTVSDHVQDDSIAQEFAATGGEHSGTPAPAHGPSRPETAPRSPEENKTTRESFDQRLSDLAQVAALAEVNWRAKMAGAVEELKKKAEDPMPAQSPVAVEFAARLEALETRAEEDRATIARLEKQLRQAHDGLRMQDATTRRNRRVAEDSRRRQDETTRAVEKNKRRINACRTFAKDHAPGVLEAVEKNTRARARLFLLESQVQAMSKNMNRKRRRRTTRRKEMRSVVEAEEARLSLLMNELLRTQSGSSSSDSSDDEEPVHKRMKPLSGETA